MRIEGILNRVMKKGITENVTFEKKKKKGEDEAVNHVDIWEKHLQVHRP